MHIGEKIEARARQLRIGSTALARMIGTSKQNVYGIYQRTSIDTELLRKLSKALDFDFFVYYSTSPVSPGQVNELNDSMQELKEEIRVLKRELEAVRQRHELLRALYELKTGEKVPGS